MARRIVSFVRRKTHRVPSTSDVEAAEWAFYSNYVRRGMVVFDVGAYVGKFTLLFAGLVADSGRVHAFEATTSSFGKLREACEAANLSNVTLNHTAVCNINGTVGINVHAADSISWSSLANRDFTKYGMTAKDTFVESVTATTIDAYCLREGIPRINLLKVDVEGAEFEVLAGAKEMLLSKRIDCCAFEFGQTTFDMGHTPGEIEALLRSCDYEVINLVAGQQPFPGGSSARTAAFSMHLARPNS